MDDIPKIRLNVAGLWTRSNEELVIWADSINSKLKDMGLSVKDDDNATLSDVSDQDFNLFVP